MNEKIFDMAKIAATALSDKKGQDIKVIKVAEKTTLADYLVICNGSSSTQIRALADECEYRLKEAGYAELHREGQPGGDWILLDFKDIIVHVFSKEARAFYDLERFWKDGEEIEVAIADFNHDVTPGGVTIPVTLLMKNCFKATRVMNNSNTNVGGWTNSNLRTSTLPSILSNFPDEWQNIMTTAQKKTAQGNNSATIVTSDDKAWLLSPIEFTGANSPSYAGEGTLYPIFTDNASRIKRVNNVANNYWTRSPAASYNQDFCFVNTAGALDHGVAGYTMGICLGFCVG